MKKFNYDSMGKELLNPAFMNKLSKSIWYESRQRKCLFKLLLYKLRNQFRRIIKI